MVLDICQFVFMDEVWSQMDGLAQERRNSIANALELRLSCTNPSKYWYDVWSHDIKFTLSSFPSFPPLMLPVKNSGSDNIIISQNAMSSCHCDTMVHMGLATLVSLITWQHAEWAVTRVLQSFYHMSKISSLDIIFNEACKSFLISTMAW